MADVISATALAQRVGLTPKRMRAFIRKLADAGTIEGLVRASRTESMRYAFDAKTADAIAEAHAAYRRSRAEA